MRHLAALLLLALPAAAHAGSVTVRNGTGETVRGIYMAPPGSSAPGENRLRSQVPPGAEARITYSTGCRADIRLAFETGRTEDHRDVEVCTEARIVAGQAGTAGPAMAAGNAPPAGRTTTPTNAKPLPNAVVKAPPPVVPPWTGRSITKKFGGMD